MSQALYYLLWCNSILTYKQSNNGKLEKVEQAKEKNKREVFICPKVSKSLYAQR